MFVARRRRETEERLSIILCTLSLHSRLARPGGAIGEPKLYVAGDIVVARV
jgi:hypothetical protein